MTAKIRQGNMVSLISVVKGLLREKVVMSMMLDILIGTAAINRALDAAEERADDQLSRPSDHLSPQAQDASLQHMCKMCCSYQRHQV
jgi:hypothetical protein